MFQRGLAILLGVCMLAGSVGDSAYAMSPQVNGQVSDIVYELEAKGVTETAAEENGDSVSRNGDKPGSENGSEDEGGSDEAVAATEEDTGDEVSEEAEGSGTAEETEAPEEAEDSGTSGETEVPGEEDSETSGETEAPEEAGDSETSGETETPEETEGLKDPEMSEETETPEAAEDPEEADGTILPDNNGLETGSGEEEPIGTETLSTAVPAQVSVEPLMLGVKVSATLEGAGGADKVYTISVQCYDQASGKWRSMVAVKDADTELTVDNEWTSTAVFCDYINVVRPNAENKWKITITGSDAVKVYEKRFTLEAVKQQITLSTEYLKSTEAQIRAVLAAGDESTKGAKAKLYCRVKGTEEWINRGTCWYAEEKGGTLYMSGLERDTEYEVQLVPDSAPDIILAQTSFRTLKDARILSMAVENCEYTSAQINWSINCDKSDRRDTSYIFLHYRKKGDSEWTYAYSYIKTMTAVESRQLKELEQGITYEVLLELKDSYDMVPGQKVVKDIQTEFTTLVADHELTAEPETEETSVKLNMQLVRSAGTPENRMRAEVLLESAEGIVYRSKPIYFNKNNQYRAQMTADGLLPNTKYTISADLYESENNQWILRKNCDLGEVVTKEVSVPISLTIEENELFLNRWMKKKLIVKAQPETAVNGLVWTSSDTSIVSVDTEGTVTAQKPGEADITVSAAATAGDGIVSAVCHVTVKDYAIRVRDVDGRYLNLSDLLSKSQQQNLIVYDWDKKEVVPGVTWTVSNPNAATISADGLLVPQNFGQTYITAGTPDSITITTKLIRVVNEIEGFSITKPEAVNQSYQAVRTAESKYQVAAGETYRVSCVLSPAYTVRDTSSTCLWNDRFEWKCSPDHAVTVRAPEDDRTITEIIIAENVTGTVEVTASMIDAEYSDKTFTITLDVLKKPEIERIPYTYTWLDYSSRLADVGLPENWKWKEKDTLLYEAGKQTFMACYEEPGCYPYETKVTVYADRIGNAPSVIGSYSASKKAYIVKTGEPLRIKVDPDVQYMPAFMCEQAVPVPAAKDSAYVSVLAPDLEKYCSVTASKKGSYTVSTAVSLKKAAFEKQDGRYVQTAGVQVKKVVFPVKFIAADSEPVAGIGFAVAKDSPEKITIADDGTIEYRITAANADTKKDARVIRLNVIAVDAMGKPVTNPKINYAVSDQTVVKLKKEGTDQLVLTIPKGADGLAKVVATSADELGYSTQFDVKVKDYTPRVTVQTAVLNTDYSPGKEVAQVVLPYDDEQSDRIESVALTKTNSKDGKDTVAGLGVSITPTSVEYKYNIELSVTAKYKIEQTGSLNYYLAIQTKAYEGVTFIPIKIRIESGLPAVTMKQTSKVNLFYTDTEDDSWYESEIMGRLEVTSSVRIESIMWKPRPVDGAGVNREFVIGGIMAAPVTQKNGKYTTSYIIRQQRPVLNGKKKPSDEAVKGYVYIRLRGYSGVIKKPLTIQTEYKKPKLKAMEYKLCPAFGKKRDSQYIYINGSKTNAYMSLGSDLGSKKYSDITCADSEVEITGDRQVTLAYSGDKDKKTQFVLDSDYWYEPLTVPVKITVAKTKVKLSQPTVILNTAYPSETTQTAATARLYNDAVESGVNVSKVRIEGANAQAQRLLDQKLLNMNYKDFVLSVSVNYAKAMGMEQIKTGTYQYKLTPYYGDTELNSLLWKVKIINKEASVKVKTKGGIDLLKLTDFDRDYNQYSNNNVTVVPVFRNLNSSYQVEEVELEGAYKKLFRICAFDPDGSLKIVPRYKGKVKAGKRYTLSVKYTVKDANGEGGETIKITSNSFIVKPKQSVPKVTPSVKKSILYASAAGESNAEKLYLLPQDIDQGLYVIADAAGSLDVNKDGKADLILKTEPKKTYNGEVQVAVYIADAAAIKATAKGVNYKIPVTVRCMGRDGVSRDATVAVSVVVKK